MLRCLIAVFVAAGLSGAAFAADVSPAPYHAPKSHAHGHGHGHGHHGYLPTCDEPQVLSKIANKFTYGDSRLRMTGLAIAEINGIHQHALRDNGPSLIKRRYCGGVAWLSNGQSSEVVYLIEAKQGFASISWNVESCLPAHDPYRVYGAYCRSLRP